ncbi:prolyl tripeptidyl peptidase precursor [bacterium BMS3Abin03]|nr:prolyl tripeptidyl peptidase precursor [bacterium BMS3Abin03]
MRKTLYLFFLSLFFLQFLNIFAHGNGFSSYDILRMKYVIETSVSPDGNYIAYTVHVPRPLSDEAGPDYRYLFVYDIESNSSHGLLADRVNVSSIDWTPDSKRITFKAKLKDDKAAQVYEISPDEGEPIRLTNLETSVIQYQFNSNGYDLAYVTLAPEDPRKVKLSEEGFNAEIYEEEYRDRNLYVWNIKSESMEPRQLTKGVSVFGFRWSPDGKQIAAFIADKNLVDYLYMFKKVYLINAKTGERKLQLDNPGKINQMAWSPDGKHLAFIAASGLHDAVTGSLFITEVPNNKAFTELRNYAKDFEGSIKKVEWEDDNTFLFLAEEGVDITLSQQGINDTERKLLIKPGEIVFHSFSFQDDLIAIAGNTWQHPSELYAFTLIDQKLSKLTGLNPWLADIKLGKQEKISYKARDGLEIQGVLIYPVKYEKGKRYPLICMIHGGPESAMQNGWQTYYSRWGQIAAAKRFFVFMPNYRASSGRGIEFTMKGFGDTGGAEFTDVLDGIDYLVKKGLVDKKRVGIGGGSYGGFFAAYGASRYSNYFAAAVMFVGISDHYSKRYTTDIPYESYYVHWGFWAEDNMKFVRERSPVTYADNCKTPLLILGGKDDPRVNPSQSLEMYRAVKLHGKAPVRLVRYPGEKHGNRKNTLRLDYSLRTMRWFEYYLNSDNPKDKMPDKYLKIENR